MRIVLIETILAQPCFPSSWPKDLERPASWKCDVKSKIRPFQTMRIYVKNISAKFHPDPILNDGALGF